MESPHEVSPSIHMMQPVYQIEGDASWKSWSKTVGLIGHMTKRSLSARYRGSALGFIWSLVNPVLMMFVYTFVFQNIFQLHAPGVPYQVYVMTGLLAWNFFSSAAIHASLSLVTGATLINKCAFPRIVLPLSAVLANGVNYLVAIPLLVVFGLIEGVTPNALLLLLPIMFLLLLIISTGIGTLLAALMPYFTDLQHLIEVVFTMWFFLTPVVYEASIVPELWRSSYQLNPLVGIIEFAHSVFLGQPLQRGILSISALVSILILAAGLFVFSRLSVHSSEV
jgi:lipopolysaccharide transport system permease protein